MSGHTQWTTLRNKRLRDPESAQRAEERRDNLLAMALAVAVYQRRQQLGLSQTETAERCGLSQAKISRIEGSDTVPTLGLLYKLSKGLDATLNIAIYHDAQHPVLTLTPHAA